MMKYSAVTRLYTARQDQRRPTRQSSYTVPPSLLISHWEGLILVSMLVEDRSHQVDSALLSSLDCLQFEHEHADWLKQSRHKTWNVADKLRYHSEELMY